MEQTNLRLVFSRAAPVLTEEYRTESLSAIVKRKLHAFAETVFFALAILSVGWALAVLLLSLEIVR